MFIPEIEKKTPAEIRKYQEKQLPGLLNYLKKKSSFYKRHFEQHYIAIEE